MNPYLADGDRVKLIRCATLEPDMQPGNEGTVLFTDDAGVVHVQWDNGSTLGLIPNEDVYERVS